MQIITPTTMNFSSNNWNQSGGFGSTNKPTGTTDTSGPTGGSLFSKVNFGGSGKSTSASSGLNLIGNSTTNANNPTNGPTGSNNLFGNNTGTSNNLFGNTGTSNNLFGSTGTSNNLFGNTGTSNNSLGSGAGTSNLLGNSSTGNTGASNAGTGSSTLFGAGTSNGTSNLFGKSNVPTGPSNGASSGSSNLFGNSQSNSQPGQTSLFGQSAPSGLSGASGPSQLGNNSNPLNYHELINNIPTNSTLPSSLTSNLFSESTPKKRRFSVVQKPKSSLLGRLGRTFKLFRSPTTNTNTKGLFTPSNFTKPEMKKKSLRTAYSAKGVGSVKRLVIKSKPLNFHLIDADKVLKRRRIISTESSDSETDEEVMNVEAPKSENTFTHGTSKATPAASNTHPLGYYSSPTIGELSKLTAQKSTKVENLVIGRIGYGQIAFSYPVDLSHYIAIAKREHISLDKVLFERKFAIATKHIRTLPDHNEHGEEIKIPVGFGVNVPATLTLENVAPQKNTSSADFIKYLQHQPGAEFVTYDPMTFKWVFKVKHFSVWGLIDDITEDDGVRNLVELKGLKRKQDEGEIRARELSKGLSERQRREQEMRSQIRDHQFMQYSQGVPGGFSFENTRESSPLEARRDIVAREIANEKKRGLLRDLLDVEIQSRLHEFEQDEEDAIPEELENGVNFSNDYLKQMISFLPKNTNLSDLVNEKAYEPEITNESIFDNIQIKSNLPVSRDWLVQLELSNDINSALNPLVLSRTEKLDLDEMLFGKFNKKSEQVVTEDLILQDIIEDDEGIYPNNIPKIIQVLLGNSTVSTKSEYPYVEQNTPQLFSELISCDLTTEEEKIVKLLSSLFDKKTPPGSGYINDLAIQNRLHVLNERRIFGDWLRFYNKSTIDDLYNKATDSFERIFILLLAGDLSGAVELAYESDNPHLAAALTTADSGEELVRSIARNQLNEWEFTGNTVSPSLIKIYQIISGDVRRLLLDLPWNLSLAVTLFFGDNTIQIGDLVNQEQIIAGESKQDGDSQIIDILKLYRSPNLDSIQNSTLNTKWKWITHKILQQSKTFTSFDDITKEFSAYLSKIGLWKDAIYVSSHLTSLEPQIRKLIIGNVSDITNGGPDEVEELCQIYKIPRNLISEAVSIDNVNHGDIWGQCRALVEAELWDQAHSTISHTLGPQVAVSDNVQMRLDLMKIISQFPADQDVIGWNSGAGIYENYFLYLERGDLDTLLKLLDIIPGATDKSTFETKTALKLISKRVGDFALDRYEEIDNIADRIGKLYFGEAEKGYFRTRLSLLEERGNGIVVV